MKPHSHACSVESAVCCRKLKSLLFLLGDENLHQMNTIRIRRESPQFNNETIIVHLYTLLLCYVLLSLTYIVDFSLVSNVYLLHPHLLLKSSKEYIQEHTLSQNSPPTHMHTRHLDATHTHKQTHQHTQFYLQEASRKWLDRMVDSLGFWVSGVEA